MVLAGVFVFTPLAVIRRTRRIAAVAFMIATPIFALMLWFSSAFAVYEYWGLAAVIVSTLGLGVGTVLLAFVEIILKGTGAELIGMILMTAVTVASGIAAVLLD